MALSMREALLPKAVIETVAAPLEIKVNKPVSETQRLKRRAAEAWNALPEERKQMWVVFAAKFRRYSAAKAKVVAPTARALFIATALERWKLDTDLPTPTDPPVKTFAGDDLGVFAVQTTKKNGIPKGVIRIEATTENRPGVMTAILVQKLSGPGRKPNARSYKAANYVIFTEDQPQIDLPVQNGHYATAYRFLDAQTLQMTPLMESGTISVGIKPRRTKPTRTPKPPITHAVIDLERFTTLHHWPS